MNHRSYRIRGQLLTIDPDINNVIRRTLETLYVTRAHKDKWGQSISRRRGVTLSG